MQLSLTPALNKLLESGVLGALLLICLFVIGYLYKQLINEKDNAIKKQTETNVVLKSVNDTMKELLIEIEQKPCKDEREKKKR